VEGARQIPLKRLGLNASKPQSKMALSEWFETYGSKPEAKVPPLGGTLAAGFQPA